MERKLSFASDSNGFKKLTELKKVTKYSQRHASIGKKTQRRGERLNIEVTCEFC